MITTYRFSELTTAQLYACLKLRVDVFVVEQNCPYPELDGLDCLPDTLHLLLWSDAAQTELCAYLRILPPGSVYAHSPAIGRVAVAAEARGKGLARTLMLAAIDTAQHCYSGQGITLSAQTYLLAFYQSLGFIRQGEPYLEDNIPHIKMYKVA